MNILITGAAGGLGYALRKHFENAGHSVTGTWHREPVSGGLQVDITSRRSVQKMFEGKDFDICFHTAAIANPDVCEKNPDFAHAVNVRGAAHIHELCRENGVRPVLFSTDYVFSGEKDIYHEEDAVDPIQVYGQTKALAEEVFLENPESVILRIGLLYNELHGPFRGMYQMLCDSSITEIRLSKDQKRYPLHTDDVCSYAERIIHDGGPPILHLTGPDVYSKYEAAMMLLELMNRHKSVIADETTTTNARRPAHVRLSLDLLRGKYPCQVTHFKDGMQSCLSSWGPLR